MGWREGEVFIERGGYLIINSVLDDFAAFFRYSIVCIMHNRRAIILCIEVGGINDMSM